MSRVPRNEPRPKGRAHTPCAAHGAARAIFFFTRRQGADAALERSFRIDDGAILKYKKGDWLCREAKLNGAVFIAHIDEVQYGWKKWKNDQIIDEELGFYADPLFKPKKREELDEWEDRTKWETDKQGKPKDPWWKGWCLRLSDEDGAYRWATNSDGGTKAIQFLARELAKRRRSGRSGLPIVKLGVRVYQHPEWGPIAAPEFEIVGWTDDEEPAPPAVGKPKPTGPASLGERSRQLGADAADPNEREHAPLEDDVPF
jgi:hypothetical protein